MSLDRVRETLVKLAKCRTEADGRLVFANGVYVVNLAKEALSDLAAHEKEDAEREAEAYRVYRQTEAELSESDSQLLAIRTQLQELLEAAKFTLTGTVPTRRLRQVIKNIEKS